MPILQPRLIGASLALLMLPNYLLGQVERESLTASLHFFAPFDGNGDAKLASSDGRIFTADTLQRGQLTPGIQRSDVSIAPGAGKFGDCLRFTAKSKQVICFAGSQMHYAEKDWSGSVSMWMRLNPDQDLLPGYCDPIQITQLAWNNAAFFVDFDKDLPRDFRLGVFSDLKYWNPDNIAWEVLPTEKRPMVTVKRPPFSREQWTHVLFTFSKVNSADQTAVATLYMNGQSQGSLKQPMQFHWDPGKVAIMLGIEYIGDIDELMIFRKELTPAEVKFLYELDKPLR